jgi:hypothetical protein
MPPNCAWMLGGFTQTSSKPSRLDCLLAEQARRGMNELCFNCGQRRFAGEHLRLRKCPFDLRGVEYECPAPACKGKLLVTSRGHAERVPEPPARAAAPNPEPSIARKRPAPIAAVAQPPRKAAKRSSHSGVRVSVCKRDYTSLSWFLNDANPSKKACAAAKKHCADGAIELEGGHVRALAGSAYAKAPPARPKPLCCVSGGGERTRMGDDPVETEVSGLILQRVQDGRLTRRLSQVLFPVDALGDVFPSS